MRWRQAAVMTAILLGLGTARAGEPEPEPGPALTLHMARPDQQLERILSLFEGSRADSPAQALADWRRAVGDDAVPLGKATQAVVALFNPEMVRELRVFDGTELVVRLDSGSPCWFARLPRDDGAVAALGAALALTDGGVEPPLPDTTVDRLGPPGAPLLARTAAGAVALAGGRDDLITALARINARPNSGESLESGWTARFLPDAVGGDGPISARRFAEALRAVGCREIEAFTALDGQVLSLDVRGHYETRAPGGGVIDPAWLEWIPTDRAAAAVVLAIEPGDRDALFAAVDRFEKADPVRARTAPLRARLDLLAMAAGARLETDFWPLLRGLTGWVETDHAGKFTGAMIIPHTADPASARRLADRVVKPLAGALRPLFGRDLEWTASGSSVAIAWGDGVLAAGTTARERPERSAARVLSEPWQGVNPQRVGAVWPSRWPRGQSAMAEALDRAGPVLWWGTSDGASAHDRVRWGELKGLVRDALNRLPSRKEAEPG